MLNTKNPLIAARRAQLVEAAINLFSRSGYHVVTVKDIADEAGVSPGLIYQYVSDKQDLLFLCLTHIVEQLKNAIPNASEGIEDPIVCLYRSVDAYGRVIDANRRYSMLTFRENKSLRPEGVEEIKRLELETNELISARVEACIRVGLLAETNVELLTFRIIIAAQGWALKQWRLRDIVTLDVYLEESIHAVWRERLLPRGLLHYHELLQSGKLTAVGSNDADIVKAGEARRQIRTTKRDA